MAKLMRRHPDQFRLSELIADFPAWRQSQGPDHNSIDDEQPWITFAAIRLLDQIVRPTSRVFEYGAGGSTIYFARRAAEVVSVEHDAEWTARVAAALAQRGLTNHCLRNIPPQPEAAAARGDPADPGAYVSLDEAYRGLAFRGYAASIDEYPDQSFDVILIDGRARPSCFVHALPKVRVGGWLLLDNTSREYYLPATRQAAGQFSQRLVAGPIPYQIDFDETTLFHRHAGPGAAS